MGWGLWRLVSGRKQPQGVPEDSEQTIPAAANVAVALEVSCVSAASLVPSKELPARVEDEKRARMAAARVAAERKAEPAGPDRS